MGCRSGNAESRAAAAQDWFCKDQHTSHRVWVPLLGFWAVRGSERQARLPQCCVGCQWLLSIAGISVSSLSDNLFVLHVHCEDNKQKVKEAQPPFLYPSLKVLKVQSTEDPA